MEMSAQVRRSLVAGACLVVAEAGVGVANGSGVKPSIAIDGAVMAGASYACDLTHNVLEMPASMASSAVCTGAIFTIAKSVVFNDDRLVMNFLLAAAADTVVDTVNDMIPPLDHV